MKRFYLAALLAVFSFGCSESSDQVQAPELALTKKSGGLYFLSRYDSLIVLDVSKPDAPRHVASIAVEYGVGDMAVNGEVVYLCDVYRLVVVDARNPLAISLDFFEGGNGESTFSDLQIDGKRLYATSTAQEDYEKWVNTYDISDPLVPRFLSSGPVPFGTPMASTPTSQPQSR